MAPAPGADAASGPPAGRERPLGGRERGRRDRFLSPRRAARRDSFGGIRFPVKRDVRYFLLLVATLAGCGYWQRDPNVLAAPLPPNRRIEIWSKDSASIVTHVQVRGDSLHGVAGGSDFEGHREVTVALSTIDSVKSRHASPGGTVLLVLCVLVVVGTWAAYASLGGPGS